MARKRQRLEPLALALLGHSNSYLVYRRGRWTQMYRFYCHASTRNWLSHCCRLYVQQPICGLQAIWFYSGQLRANWPTQTQSWSDHLGFAIGQTHETRGRPHWRLVRLRCYALCSIALSFWKPRAHRQQFGFPSRLYRWGRGPNPRMVLYPPCHFNYGFWF